MSDRAPTTETLRAHVRVARRHRPESDFAWAFALRPHAIDRELRMEGGDPLQAGVDHVGLLTLGGERLPLTPRMVAECGQLVWLGGTVAGVLELPSELEWLDPHDPLPYLDLLLAPGSTLPPGGDEPSPRLTMTCSLDPEHCRRSSLVLVCRRRPDAWPR